MLNTQWWWWSGLDVEHTMTAWPWCWHNDSMALVLTQWQYGLGVDTVTVWEWLQFAAEYFSLDQVVDFSMAWLGWSCCLSIPLRWTWRMGHFNWFIIALNNLECCARVCRCGLHEMYWQWHDMIWYGSQICLGLFLVFASLSCSILTFNTEVTAWVDVPAWPSCYLSFTMTKLWFDFFLFVSFLPN